MSQPDSNLVVFDTREYAGNFERDMCAFITSRTGDIFVGEEIADAVRDSLKHLDWYENNIYPREDEEGLERLVECWPTPGRVNYKGYFDFNDETRANFPAFVSPETHPAYHSVAILVDELPPEEVLAEMVERAQLFCKQRGLTYVGYRVLEPQYESVQVEQVSGYNTVA